MKSHFFLSCLIAFGAFIILFKFHFFLGSLLTIFQIPILLFSIWILFRRRKQGFETIHKILIGINILLLINIAYEQVSRLSFQDTSGTQKELSILTYNLFFKNKYPQQIIREIQHTDADVLVVQELTGTWKNTLSKHIYAQYPYRKLYAHKGTHGLGVLSKFPIESNTFLKNGSGLPVSQVVQLSVNGKELILVNAHLASPAAAVENPERFYSLYARNAKIRKEQWKELMEHLSQYKEIPQIIAGDLNTMKIEPLYLEMRHYWKDLFAKKGKGFGKNFPNVLRIPFPVITLDYILFRGKVKPVRAEVLKGSSSDHLAILGVIKI